MSDTLHGAGRSRVVHPRDRRIGFIPRAAFVNGRDKTAAAEKERRKKVINDERYESPPEDALCHPCNADDDPVVVLVHACHVHAAGILGYIQPAGVTAIGNLLRMADEKAMAVGKICQDS